MRFTKLNTCGAYDTGTCAQFVAPMMIVVDQTGETEKRVEFPVVNADGTQIYFASDPERLKYLNLEMTLTDVTPQLINWAAGETVVNDDAAVPSAIGWFLSEGSARLGNIAVEIWTRLHGTAACVAGGPRYGYVAWPWVTEGTMLGFKSENGTTELKINGRTSSGSPWGVGPYPIVKSLAVATLGNPLHLTPALRAIDHRVLLVTTLAPPLATTDCAPVVGTLAVVDDDGAGPLLAATATLPTAAGAIPGTIDWGDLDVDVVLAGPTAAHVYAAAGTYTVTYRSSTQSGPTYVGSVTMA